MGDLVFGTENFLIPWRSLSLLRDSIPLKHSIVTDYKDIFFVILPIFFITSAAVIQPRHSNRVFAMQKIQVRPQPVAHCTIVPPHFAHSAGVQP